MRVFRLTKKKHQNDLSGKGAELNGGRWNGIGTPMLYTCENRSLCLAEVLVHLRKIIPDDYVLVTLEIPDDLEAATFDKAQLPEDWKNTPPSKSTQRIGNQFVEENKALLLKVPSVVVPGDFNILINPNHPDFGKVKVVEVEVFEFDERLFK